MVQLNAEAGNVPSCGSVAEPEKLITSPTFHVVAAVGVEMVAVGGLKPAAMTIALLTVDCPLLLSVTRRCT